MDLGLVLEKLDKSKLYPLIINYMMNRRWSHRSECVRLWRVKDGLRLHTTAELFKLPS